MSRWPSELHVLVHLTRDQNDQALKAALSTIGDIDWRRLIELSAHHRVDCLVALNLAAHTSAGVPDSVRDHFATRLRRRNLQSLAMTRATGEVTDALLEAEIPNILLKGPAVSSRFYRSPGARQSIDIDILISDDDAIRARSIIEGLGFDQLFPAFDVPPGCEDIFRTLTGDVKYQRASDGVQVELHWRLDRNRRFLTWSFDTVRQFSTPMTLAGTEVSVMAPAAQFVYLICHGAKHAWFRMKWLADIYRMLHVLTDEQTAEVVRLSQRNGTIRMLATSLRLAQIVYEMPAGKFAKHKLGRHEDQHLLDHMIGSIARIQDSNGIRFQDLGNLFRSFRYRFDLRSDLSYKGSVVLQQIADVRDVQTLRLSRKWLWLYVLAGPCLGAIRVCKRDLKALSQLN